MKNSKYSSMKQIACALRSRNRCKRLAAVKACEGREDIPQELLEIAVRDAAIDVALAAVDAAEGRSCELRILELAARHSSYFVAGHVMDIAATRDETMISVIMAGLRHFDGEVVESAVWAAAVHGIPAETIHSWLTAAVLRPITA